MTTVSPCFAGGPALQPPPQAMQGTTQANQHSFNESVMG
jgi:hypothetical protein